jgi:hypothetical protein
MTDYKQLAQELYEALRQVRNLMNDANGGPINSYCVTKSMVYRTIQKYEEATTRGTGRTTALYMKAIVEALENPGKGVEFIDHYPHKWESARLHEDALKTIIEKLNYNIIVQTKGQAQVYLYNRFGL